MDLKELDFVDPSHHWYYQSKLRVLRQALTRWSPAARAIVDVGAGSGFFATQLTDLNAGGHVTCVDPHYDSESIARAGALRFTRVLPPKEIPATDLFLFIDVLEHVVDDVALLREYTATARPGAYIFVTVPAFMSLWSAHDVYLEHERRYTLQQLTRQVELAGLEVLHGRYIFASIFPVAWLVRRLRRTSPAGSDMKPVPKPLNWLLTMVSTEEHRVPRNRVAGLSAFVVARVGTGS
jgi:2-polyprenyl-3-methyl-5-hydroxy-6-metoxy-1,4-benzoquinol methylase